MHRFLIFALLLFAPLAWTQEADEGDAADAAEPAETTDEESADSDGEVDDFDVLDELYPVEDEDEFIPSEDVAFGQSIPFPTDI